MQRVKVGPLSPLKILTLKMGTSCIINYFYHGHLTPFKEERNFFGIRKNVEQNEIVWKNENFQIKLKMKFQSVFVKQREKIWLRSTMENEQLFSQCMFE